MPNGMSHGAERAGAAPELQKKMTPEQRAEIAKQKLTAQLNEKHPKTVADIGNEAASLLNSDAVQKLSENEKQDIRMGIDKAVMDYIERTRAELKQTLGDDVNVLVDEVNKRLDKTI